MYTMLKQRRMRWLGHVSRMEDGRIPKDLLYGELKYGSRPRGRPQLRYKDICKRDLKAININTDSWEEVASQRIPWKQTVRSGLKQFEKDQEEHREAKRHRRKASCGSEASPTTFTCLYCRRDCHSNIGLVSHTRRCQTLNTNMQSMVSRDWRKPTMLW